jgi:peptidoglycan/LPS O-acetylase OafA/YrhL
MGERQTESRWFRLAFGRPRLRQGLAWIGMALAWLAVTVTGGNQSGYLLSGVWALLGCVVLTVAVRDRRRGHGAYARPVAHLDD